MPYDTIIFHKEEPLATVTLNRPDRLNAIDGALATEFLDAVGVCAEDATIRALIVTGAGRGFCSGGDQKRERSPANNAHNAAAASTLVDLVHRLILALRNLPKPVIAAINGPAAGAGFNLALACDFRVAAETARFNEAFVKVGISPDSGGSYWLPRLVGLAKATELIFTGDMIDAREAERLGLVNKVVPGDQLEAAARELALRLANGPTLALGRAKVLLGKSQQNDLAAQLDLEREMLRLSYQTEDYREGVKAFVEKRAPAFTGR